MNVIATRRLSAQRLLGEPFDSVTEAVGRLGAVQSQDYAGAKWALAQRTRGVRDADLDRAFDAGALLRTHVLRPTWHFVLPADIRWLLELTGPRVKARLALYDGRLEVDAALIRRCESVFEAALRDGASLTRTGLSAALETAGISAAAQRLGHLVMHAELDGVIASGPRRGKQFTYALLEERAAGARRLQREEALAELAVRYFSGHGPAQVEDCAWWSGLTMADVRRGLNLAGPALAREEFGGKPYWSSPDAPVADLRGPIVHLLPNYDEYLVAYRDRSAALDPARGFDLAPFPNGSILAHALLLNGQIWGGWKRRLGSRTAAVELGALDVMTAAEAEAIGPAADRFGHFLGLPVTVTRSPSG